VDGHHLDPARDVSIVRIAPMPDLDGGPPGVAALQEDVAVDADGDVAGLQAVGVVVAVADLGRVQAHVGGAASAIPALEHEAAPLGDHRDVALQIAAADGVFMAAVPDAREAVVGGRGGGQVVPARGDDVDPVVGQTGDGAGLDGDVAFVVAGDVEV